MRLCLATALLATCLVAGCATGPRPGVSPSARAFGLTDAEVDFARALAHYGVGLVHESEDGWDSPSILENYRKAISLDPLTYRLYARTAAILLQSRKIDEAIALLEEACAADPDNFQARLDLAVTCEATRNFKDAIAHYGKAISMSPSMGHLYCQLARTHFKNDDDVAALAVLSKGMKKASRPETVTLYCYNAGVEFIAKRQVARAIKCFEALIEQDPPNRDRLHLLLGELHQSAGNLDEALRHLTITTKGKEARPDSYLKLAALHASTDPQRSIEILERAATRFPKDPAIPFSLGLIHSQQDQYTEAIEAFRRAEGTADTAGGNLNAVFYLHYGAAYERAGRVTEAARVFSKCVELYPDDHVVLNYLAYMWAEADIELDTALTHVRHALELQPENGAYVDTLGWVYYRQEKYPEALAQIQKANALIPDDPTITDHLGDVWDAMGNSENATAFWRTSFVIDPGNEAVAAKLTQRGEDVGALREEADRYKRRKEREAEEKKRTASEEPSE